MPLTINFVGGPYCGQSKTIEGLPILEAKDGDFLRIPGTEGEKYVYQLAGDTAYFVEVEHP